MWLIKNFWCSVKHRKRTGPGSTRCLRCGYHYSGLHRKTGEQ